MFADPAGLSFSGITGEGGIPAQALRFRGRGESATVACQMAAAGDLPAPPAGAVRLVPAAFTFSGTRDRAVRVEISGEGLEAGHWTLRIECDAGSEE